MAQEAQTKGLDMKNCQKVMCPPPICKEGGNAKQLSFIISASPGIQTPPFLFGSLFL